MNEQVTVRTDGYLRELLANPTRAAAPPRRMSARTVRLGLAAMDAMQVAALGLATRTLFPDAAAMFDAWEALGLGVVAAALAVAARRAQRTARRPLPDAAGVAAARAAVAVVVAVIATGAICTLALSQTTAVPHGLTGWFAAWAAISAVLAAAMRECATRLAPAMVRGRHILLVGAPDQTRPVTRAVAAEARGSWSVLGSVDDREADGLDRLVRMIEEHGPDIVALGMTGPDAPARMAAISEHIADQPVRVCLMLDTSTLVRVPTTLPRIGRIALVDLAADPHGSLEGAAKRAMDIGLGGLALLVLAPVLAAAALAIRLESPGPVLFRQWRFGMGSRPIMVLKFRTMRTDSCDATGERRTTARDLRVTRVGRLLRRTSTDELPQLINVLRGEMSLVGPRPHPLHMRVGGAYYFEAVERYRARHLVTPGITGWAQVNGSRGEVDTIEKAHRRVELDLWYLDNWSLALDLRILLRTALGGFASPGAD